jgi:hypothetical protein
MEKGKKTPKIKEIECPAGGIIGVNCYKLDECKECNVVDICEDEGMKKAAEREQLKMEKKLETRLEKSLKRGKGCFICNENLGPTFATIIHHGRRQNNLKGVPKEIKLCENCWGFTYRFNIYGYEFASESMKQE